MIALKSLNIRIDTCQKIHNFNAYSYMDGHWIFGYKTDTTFCKNYLKNLLFLFLFFIQYLLVDKTNSFKSYTCLTEYVYFCDKHIQEIIGL